jgi:flagellar hook-basal body complex protein FliE
MDVRALSAANAYATALGRARLNPQAAAGDGPAAGGKGAGFADLVKQAAGDVVQTTRAAEQMSIAGATRGAELTDVVAAVSNAEMTLETVVAVRDKVIAAYQEIMRMQI